MSPTSIYVGLHAVPISGMGGKEYTTVEGFRGSGFWGQGLGVRVLGV